MLFRKKDQSYLQSESFSAVTWRRFRKNKPAVAGMWVIILAAIVAVLGYLITPDATPYANSQKPELHICEPGFKVHLLAVTRSQPEVKTSWFSRMLWGEENKYIEYPFASLKYDGPNILIEEYTGSTPNNGDWLAFNLADVVYALDHRKMPVYDSLRKSISFVTLADGTSHTETIAALREKVEKRHLVEKRFILGTDLLGRDLLSRLMIGTRISLTVGLISVFISLFIGITLGALAGFYRGALDAAISWLINVVWSIPTLLLVIAITLVLGKGITQVFIAVGLTMWVEVARIVRGQVLSIREKEFVEAGRALGYTNGRIIFKHILPNIMGPVIVIAAGNFASAILTEAGLSFLGIGAQPPTPSWGEMINAHRGYILMDKAYLAFVPGVAIMILVLAFMMVGNGLRDAMDTRLSDEVALV